MTNDSSATVQALGTALNTRDRAAVVRLSTTLINGAAPLGARWKPIALALLQSGELELSGRAAELYLSASGGSPTARLEVAGLHAQRGDLAMALTLLDAPGVAGGNRSAAAYLRGTIALNSGAFADAREHLLEALSDAPASGQICLALSQTGTMDVGSDAAAAIIDATGRMASADPVQRAQHLYALGKIHDDHGEYAPAFEAFASGAAIMARLRSYDAERDAAGAAAAIRGYSADTIETLGRGISVATDTAIIVTGLPRSGSTLIEQILASHSAVGDGAELGLFRHVIAELGGAAAGSIEAYAARDDLDELTRLYLRLARERIATGRFVDKTLDASRYLGAIATLLPDAPIVWVRRDPLDCAWSCFRTFLLRGADWSWSQQSIAAHFRLEDALFQQWHAILGQRLLEIDYAALVRDPGAVIPDLLAHCGLAPEPGVMTPERTKRTVTTASVAQVRQPIHTGAIGAAAPYREWLKPFLIAYGSA